VEVALTSPQEDAAFQDIAQLDARLGVPRGLGLVLDRTLAGWKRPNLIEPVHDVKVYIVELFDNYAFPLRP
jgi:hypothetical protein